MTLPYITWGLIQDLKIKQGDPNNYFIYHWTLIQDLKIKQGKPNNYSKISLDFHLGSQY